MPRIAHKYWDMRDKLTYDNSFLLKGSRITIPPTLRESFLPDLLEDHTGIAKNQLTARTLIYLPGIDKDIKDYFRQCLTYVTLSPTIPSESLLNPDIPQSPLKNVADLTYQLGWQKVPTHHRLFLQVSIPFPNVLYHH